MLMAGKKLTAQSGSYRIFRWLPLLVLLLATATTAQTNATAQSTAIIGRKRIIGSTVMNARPLSQTKLNCLNTVRTVGFRTCTGIVEVAHGARPRISRAAG